MISKPVELNHLIQNLRNGPVLLANLMARIPTALLKKHRSKGKWCIHSHACHIVDVQPMLIARLDRFVEEAEPNFIPYLPDHQDVEKALLKLDLEKQLKAFPELRALLIKKIKALPPGTWEKKASHPEYVEYTPGIMIRHIMLHDYLHMYRIEELWLSKPRFLKK
jgi:hypothetical protein